MKLFGLTCVLALAACGNNAPGSINVGPSSLSCSSSVCDFPVNTTLAIQIDISLFRDASKQDPRSNEEGKVPVQLAVAGLPDTITATFGANPLSVASSDATTLTLAASPSAQVGDVAFTITATNAKVTGTSSLTLHVH